MRPGETWLTISVPWAPDSVRNSAVTASSVVTARRSPFADPVTANACACSCDARSGKTVAVWAQSAAIRSPVMNSTRSHQCEPMSAKARDGPPRSASIRQLSSSAEASQSCR